MLSRLKSRAEQEHILTGLKDGAVDIVIGTHRLVQRDVGFKDLGLAIVDEEQRFGVRQKEFLKTPPHRDRCPDVVGDADSPHPASVALGYP